MRKILEKTLKINVPFFSVNGYVILSQIEKMNDIQSRIALLITSHRELGISSMTLGDAIEQVFGLIPNNQPIIKDDILELVNSKTIDAKLDGDNIFKQKVMILDLRMNKGIKEDIKVREKYSLITSNNRRVNKKLAVEMFEGFGVIESPVFVKQTECKPKNFKEYSNVQFKDLIEQHISIRENETLERVSLDSENIPTAWIKNELKVEIGGDIKALNDDSERLLDLLSSGNLGIDPSSLINDEINSLELMHTDEELKVEETIDLLALKDSNEAVETKYEITKYGIKKFYESSFYSKLGINKIEIKEIVSDKQSFETLFKLSSNKISVDMLKQLGTEGFDSFIEAAGSGLKINDEARKYAVSKLSLKQFKLLSNDSPKNIINSRELFDLYFETNVAKFKQQPELIEKILVLGFVSEEWLLKNTMIQYGKNRILKDWKLETNFFKVIEEHETLDIKGETKKQIEVLIDDFRNRIPEIFHNQRRYKDVITKLMSAKDIASEWDEDKIIAEGNRLRSRLETLVRDSYSGNGNVTFREMTSKLFKPKYAKTMDSSYKELSNVVSHNLSKTSNLEKEKIVKKNISKLEEIFSKDLNILKLVKKQTKKEASNVA